MRKIHVLVAVFLVLLWSIKNSTLKIAARTNDDGLPPCAEAWAGMVPMGSHHYLPDDTRLTERGNEGYATYKERVKRTECEKEWTILVYMAADNDLAPYALADLHEMEAGYASGQHAAASTLRTDLVVQAQLAGESEARRLHLFQSSKPWVNYTSLATLPIQQLAQVESPVVEFVPPKSAAQAFDEFLEWGVKNYPSRRVMVVVWGHGQGWTATPSSAGRASGRSLHPEDFQPRWSPQNVGDQAPFQARGFGGLAFSDGTQSWLDIPTLATSLERVSRQLRGGKPFDLYASDACLMQMVEVAYELAPVTRFVVGSASIQTYFGLPYRRLLFEINTGRFAGKKASTGVTDEAHLAALMLPDLQRASLNDGGLQSRLAPETRKTLTMSSLSSPALEQNLVPAAHAFGKAMVALLEEDAFRAADLEFLAQEAPAFQGGGLSLSYFLSAMRLFVERERERMQGTTPALDDVEKAIEHLWRAERESVLAYVMGSDYVLPSNPHFQAGFRSLSFWLPSSPEAYVARSSDFSRSRFYRALGEPGANPWEKWLQMVFAP